MSIKSLCQGFIIFLFLQGVSVAQVANTTTATGLADEADYFATVNETGGYVNKELHDAFWQMMSYKYLPEQREKIVTDILSALEILKDFQLQTWESARQSYYAKQMLWKEGFHPLREKLMQMQSPYFSAQSIAENAQKIVHGAASRESIDLGGGKFYITPELIEENLVGMQGGYERLKLLLMPNWHEELKEYTLPKIRVRLLSLYAPDEYEENVNHHDETLALHIAQLATDKQSVFEVGAVDYQKQDKKFSNFSQPEKQMYLQEFIKEQFAGYKVTDPVMSYGNWRGHHFTKGVANYQNYHIIIMSLFMGDKALYIKHVSEADLSLTSANFNDFTKRIQLLEQG